MPFRRFALFFRQDFVGGYRYLDRCGEFLVRAQQEMNLLPTGETTPSGGAMEDPERGIKVEFNTTRLRVSHELPGDDLETFGANARYVSQLYQELFQPLDIDRAGVAINCYLPFNEAQQAEAASLQWGLQDYGDLAKIAGMSAESRVSEYCFLSGSRRLRLKIHPVAFEQIKATARNPPMRATKRQRQIIERENAGIQRALQTALSHALFAEFDLTEQAPPSDVFDSLLIEVVEKQATILSALSAKL